MRRRRSQRDFEMRRMLACAGLIFVLLVIIAALLLTLVPFKVNLRAEYDRLEGGQMLLSDTYGNSVSLEDDTGRAIETGETITVAPGSTVRVEIVRDSNAFAYLIGPAEWKLVSAWREATALNHVLGKAEDYQVIIEQIQGTAVYDFSQADPSPDKLNVLIRLSEGEVRPAADCFQVSEGNVVEIPCGTEITPMPAPTLPALP